MNMGNRMQKQVLLSLMVLEFFITITLNTAENTVPMGFSIPKPPIIDCVRNMKRLKGCQDQLQSLFKHKPTELVPECCRAITGMSDYCMKLVFSSSFSLSFGNAVKKLCNVLGYGPSSPPKDTLANTHI
ncbi:hypothetical protein Acr_28g0013320 [Actinidia rufa]|uniref:Prolamin-like domain-containing protein n=1 Tax=Actinidia rufa TaxID=165716 RepID=A0A7J0HBY1_9ERIC|nr:hypothetical protein Acr_28g0013320 [Actinidia rufa]